MMPDQRDAKGSVEKYGKPVAAGAAFAAFMTWFLPEYTELKTTVLIQKATIEFHIKTLYEKVDQHAKHKPPE